MSIRPIRLSGQQERTYQPLPESLPGILRRRFVVSGSFNRGNAAGEVHVFGFDGAPFAPYPRANVQDGEHNERKIVGDERRCIPTILQKHRPSTELET